MSKKVLYSICGGSGGDSGGVCVFSVLTYIAYTSNLVYLNAAVEAYVECNHGVVRLGNLLNVVDCHKYIYRDIKGFWSNCFSLVWKRGNLK